MKNKPAAFALRVISIALAILFLLPCATLVLSSFKTLKGIALNPLALPNAATFTLQNYPDAFNALDYFTSFGNSLLITGCGTLGIIVFSTMAAWVLVRNRGKKSTFIFMTLSVSMLVPFQCVMFPLVKLMGSLHMLSRFGLIFMNIGFACPLTIMLFHGFIKSIPMELEEAAAIDGCTELQQFFYVVVPLLKSIAVTAVVLNAKVLWNDYLLPSLTINRPGQQTLPLKTFLFFGQYVKRWNLGTAGLVMAILPVIVAYVLGQRYIIQGITDGAVKG